MVEINAHDHFYQNVLLVNEAFGIEPTFEFGFTVGDGAILIFNDSNKVIDYSFNGRVLHGQLQAKDKWRALDRKKESRIWLRVNPGSGQPAGVRVEAWL